MHPIAINLPLITSMIGQISRTHALYNCEIVAVQNVSPNNWTATFTCEPKNPGHSRSTRLAHFQWVEFGEGVTNGGFRLLNDIIVS